MPLTIELQDAAPKVKHKFGRFFSEAERIFQFTQEPVDFISNGIVSNDQFTSVLDGDPVLRRFRNMTINAGHTVTPTQRCKGMYLLIEEDLIINGTLSMTARGAKAPGKFVGVDNHYGFIYFNETNIFADSGLFTIGKVGGVTPLVSNSVAANGANNACAGGGSGSVGSGKQGYGGPGTSFSGGPGGGGSPAYNGGNGAADGGAGGNAASYNPGCLMPAGGGAGNPGGARGAGQANEGGGYGGNGTGGLMILIVKGNIIFGPTGQIISAGSAGGWGNASGGGSGGGAIHIFHKGTISNPEKVTAPGGSGGSATAACARTPTRGKDGGHGSITFNKF